MRQKITPAACPKTETVPGCPPINIALLGKNSRPMERVEDVIMDLEQALSVERFARYLEWARGDRRLAIELYTLNTRVSESLYTPLQMLEVALRNRIHGVMTASHQDLWFCDAKIVLVDHQAEQVAKAVRHLESEGKEMTPGRIVAALTFSFWTSMFSPVYETLWQTSLHRIATRPDGRGLRRKDFSSRLRPIRTLRNRIAHHEPIIMWNLRRHHQNMMDMTEWLSPPAAAWCRLNCRFGEVYSADRSYPG